MTDTKRLREKIDESGLKLSYIASKLNITRYALLQKIKNTTQFKAEEIKILCDVLNITSLTEKELIFFADEVDITSTSLR